MAITNQFSKNGFVVVNINNNHSVSIINSNNVYYGNNSTITGGCKSGYLEVDSNGNPDNNAIVYTCNNGSWSKNSGRCEKMCIGRPTLDAGSSYRGYEGTFYDANMNVTTAANSSSYARHGAIFDVNCMSGYTEIYLVDYSNVYGKKSDWGHYYYCNNGNWETVSRCIGSGNNIYSTAGSYSVTTPNLNTNEQLTLNLEIYGAQGGGSGGKGGKTTANYTITSAKTLYIKVGEGGGSGCSSDGGARDGGGATYITLKDDTLRNFSSDYKDKVLVVAGGGGGSAAEKCVGGAGGGNNSGGEEDGCKDAGKGGYMDSNGNCTSGIKSGSSAEYYNSGSFGIGGNTDHSCDKTHGGAGGGGLCGGASGSSKDKYGGGGGGSGYCNISLVKNCGGKNGANGSDTKIDEIRTNGNGFAKISW